MERLSKIISRSGLCSRRAAEKLITSGHVLVDQQCILIPEHHVDPGKQAIVVEGKTLPKTPSRIVYLLHKPRGFVCSNIRETPKQRLVFDLLPQTSSRLFSIGRLDKDTEGLLLITNDGFLKHAIIHPKKNIEREYILKTKQFIEQEHLIALQKPVYIQGKRVEAKKVKKVRKNTCSVTVTDGKKHEVRLFALQAKLDLLQLKRVRIGNLRLGGLEKGCYKVLTQKEILAIG